MLPKPPRGRTRQRRARDTRSRRRLTAGLQRCLRVRKLAVQRRRRLQQPGSRQPRTARSQKRRRRLPRPYRASRPVLRLRRRRDRRQDRRLDTHRGQADAAEVQASRRQLPDPRASRGASRRRMSRGTRVDGAGRRRARPSSAIASRRRSTIGLDNGTSPAAIRGVLRIPHARRNCDPIRRTRLRFPRTCTPHGLAGVTEANPEIVYRTPGVRRKPAGAHSAAQDRVLSLTPPTRLYAGQCTPVANGEGQPCCNRSST